MEFYEVPHERYEILLGDLFDRINDVKQCDVVFCFGILYHISDHMLLLSKIAELEPRVLIVDSAVSRLEDPVIEVRNPRVGDLPDASPIVEGWPSKSALDAMLWSLGWTAEYFDWAGSGLTESPELHDYRTGGRVTAVVKCNEVAPELRDRAVQVVLNRHAHTKWQKGLAIVEEAAKVGMTPQALRFWVGRAERQRSRPSE
jgi:hypothetical protein